MHGIQHPVRVRLCLSNSCSTECSCSSIREAMFALGFEIVSTEDSGAHISHIQMVEVDGSGGFNILHGTCLYPYTTARSSLPETHYYVIGRLSTDDSTQVVLHNNSDLYPPTPYVSREVITPRRMLEITVKICREGIERHDRAWVEYNASKK